MSILIVEDTGVSALLLQHHLAALGHVVITARSGAEAITALGSNPDVRVVITDLLMPDMDGFTLIGKLREHEQWRDLPVIVASGVTDVPNVKRIAALGVKYYIVKPIKRAELEKTLELALSELEEIQLAHAEVMSALALDADAYDKLAAGFDAMVVDLLAKLDGGQPALAEPDVRGLLEVATLFNVERLQELAARLLHAEDETTRRESVDTLARALRSARRSLQRRPDAGRPDAPGQSSEPGAERAAPEDDAPPSPAATDADDRPACPVEQPDGAAAGPPRDP